MRLDSLNRLGHLFEIATARHLASRDLGDRLRTVRDERRRALDRREHVLAVGQYAPTGTDEEVTLQGRREALRVPFLALARKPAKGA